MHTLPPPLQWHGQAGITNVGDRMHIVAKLRTSASTVQADPATGFGM